MSTAVARRTASSSYTDSKTHRVSARTRSDTQAPRATNDSAAVTCFGSSRAIRRTRTLVSTARMPLSHVPPNPLFQLGDASRFRNLGEQLPMNLLRTVSTRLPDHDPFAVLVPFPNGTGAESQLPPHLRGNRDLSLCGHLRLCEHHASPVAHYRSNDNPHGTARPSPVLPLLTKFVLALDDGEGGEQRVVSGERFSSVSSSPFAARHSLPQARRCGRRPRRALALLVGRRPCPEVKQFNEIPQGRAARRSHAQIARNTPDTKPSWSGSGAGPTRGNGQVEIEQDLKSKR